MKNFLLLFLLLFISTGLRGQDPDADYSWWNNMHGWEPGDPGWRNWMKITPGYLGPNALPVPAVKRGVLKNSPEFALSFSNHFYPGDPTQDVSGNFYLPFAGNKIALEVYGVFLERFAFSENIRNERVARIEDGRGLAVGDIYFSTLIPLFRNREFPNTLLRATTKTASGNMLEGARYTDSPGYFFDLSFSKEWGNAISGILRPFGLFGFYSWQTNDELNLQNDAFMYALGLDYLVKGWRFSTSWAGYSGYKNEKDSPAKINLELRRDFKQKALRLEYCHGLRDWEYKTIRFTFIWKFKPGKEENQDMDVVMIK